jgi:adenine-specific DNA glycosylase
MLNMTNRKQVEQVLPEFMERWPTPEQFMKAEFMDVGELCVSLGFARRRTVALKKMTERYLTVDWDDARELHGIGAYGGAAWDIFCQGKHDD